MKIEGYEQIKDCERYDDMETAIGDIGTTPDSRKVKAVIVGNMVFLRKVK